MKLIVDSNVLVRAIVEDDARQAKAAQAALAKADKVAPALLSLCELAWVLSQGYGIPNAAIAKTLRNLVNAANVAVNRPAAVAGLALLEAGGDFADGAIAHEGDWLGAETFLSFDKKAVKLMESLGKSARVLA